MRHHLLISCLLLAAVGCAGAGLPEARSAQAGADPERPHGAQLVQLAELFAERGDRVRAAQYYSAAQRDGVPAREVLPKLVALYVADGQYRLAIEESEGYLRRHPGDHRIRSCLAGLYVAIDALPEAMRAYELLLRDRPRDPEAHFALGSLLLETGGPRARANDHFQTYLALSPRGPHAEEAEARLLKDLR